MTGERISDTFRTEVRELADFLVPEVVDIESSGIITSADSANILRRLHSAKGAANLAGVERAAQVLHALESVFRLQPALHEGGDVVDAVLDALDLVQRLAETPDADLEIAPTLERLSRLAPVLDSLTEQVGKTYPGIPGPLLAALTEEQEQRLLQLSGTDQRILVLFIALPRSEFRQSSRRVNELLTSLGEIVGCTGAGFTSDEDPLFAYLLATSASDEETLRRLERFSVRLYDGRAPASADSPLPMEEEALGAVEVAESEVEPVVEPAPAVEPLSEEDEDAALIRELREVFFSELGEQMETFSELLAALQQRPDERSLIDDVFRFGHSIKGQTGTLGLATLMELGGALEDVLSEIRNGRLSVTEPIIDLFYEWSDVLTATAATTRAGEVPPATDIVSRLERVAAGEMPPPSPASPPSPTPPPVESEPASPPPASTEPAQPPQQEAPPAPPVHPTEESIRVSLSKIDALVNTAGELVHRRSALEHLQRSLAGLHAELAAKRRAWRDDVRQLRRRPEARRCLDEPDVRQWVDGVDFSLAELSEQAMQLFEQCESLAGEMSLLVDQLSEESVRVRMLPLRTLFQRFPRMVRDLSRSLGKEVALEMSGHEVELDKMMLEQLSDPLVHMLRNCVDHGIEPPDERERAGKPRRGRITLRAEHRENQVVIELSDDGGGISVEQVGQRAVQAGLVSADALQEMTDTQVLDFIFAPGFTTREQATDVSGRGVGMDVVRTNIRRLQGQVDLESTPGVGSTFRLRLPLTLSIIQSLVVRDLDAVYCLPSAAVDEIVRVPRSDLRLSGGAFTISHRDQVLPVVGLRAILNTDGQLPEGDALSVVVLAAGQRRLGVAVDRVDEETEIVIKPMGALLRKVPNVSGVTLLGDGRLSVVLDAASLAANAVHAATAQTAAPSSPAAETATSAPGHILVVEDSLTSRQMVVDILEFAGYRVDAAVDGQDAWERLSAESFDLVVTDVDMPRMDGLELTRRIRRHEHLSHVPVIMVTGLGRDEEKRAGLQAGANAYIVKRTFDQGVLLDRIAELLGPRAAVTT